MLVNLNMALSVHKIKNICENILKMYKMIVSRDTDGKVYVAVSLCDFFVAEK